MKLDRLVSILIVLLRKEKVQARELAEMFDVSVRTILRDVDAINLAGIPIVTYQGANGGIGIAEGFRLDKSVLTSDEMSAVIAMLKGMAGTAEGPEHNILIEKLKNTLPPPQLKMLDSKVNRMVIDLSPWGGDGPVREMVTAIRRAIDELREIEFTYINQQGAKTRRRVEPYSVVLKAQKWYLYAWCSMRREFRLFKLSRVKELTVTDCRYNSREISVEELPWDADWQKPQNMVELELVFIKEMEGIIEEWFQDEISYLEDGRILVKTKLPENNWLYGFLLSYGTTLEVVSPLHIRSILRDTAAEIYNKYK